jgi:hypothetical protein
VSNDWKAVRSSLRLTIPALATLLALGSVEQARPQQQSQPPPRFEDLLKKISSAPANSCDYPQDDFSDLEQRIFEQADGAVVQGLNDKSSAPLRGPALTRDSSGSNPTGGGPRARAIEALEKLARLSAEINKSWPAENRFHFQVLDLAPALLVKMTYRNRATFSFFAIPQRDFGDKPAGLWRAIGALDDHRYKAEGGYEWLDLYPLGRGPSNRARFLANFGGAGCGTGVGVSYTAYEWSPKYTGELSEFIKLSGNVSKYEQTGARGQSASDREDSFEPVGKLRTNGSMITLPYCWFSGIDTYNNPSLCAVNSYDISGDRVRFVSSVFNRPDLLPIAKAIEYAQARDYPAVLAYCGSPDVARKMVANVPPFVFAGAEFKVERISELKKRVVMGDDPAFRFDVEKRGGRWLVVSYQME